MQEYLQVLRALYCINRGMEEGWTPNTIVVNLHEPDSTLEDGLRSGTEWKYSFVTKTDLAS